MKFKGIALAVLTALFAVSATSMCAMAGTPTSPPNVTNIWIVKNYTISTNTYAQGGINITINATVGNMLNETGDYEAFNVTALIYNDTELVTEVQMTNKTATINSSATVWNCSYTVMSYSFTSAGNITINASSTNVTGDFQTNTTEELTWRVDNNDPATEEWDNTNATVGSVERNVCVNVTDNVAHNYTVDIGWVTKPADSALSNTTMTKQSGGAITETQYCYDLIPDVSGTYYFSVTPYDNVTNFNESNQQYVTFEWTGGGSAGPSGGALGTAVTTTTLYVQPTTTTTRAPVATGEGIVADIVGAGRGVVDAGKGMLQAPGAIMSGMVTAISKVPGMVYDAIMGLFVGPLMSIFGM